MTTFKRETGKVTRAEIHLRKALKYPIKVEAQKTITCKNGREYVVDLFLNDFLVVEVDGDVHDTPQQQGQDKRRDRDLTESGYPVLRVRNYDVWVNLKTVMKRIRKALKAKPC